MSKTKKKVRVDIPITGFMSAEIEVPEDATKDEMYEAATTKWGEDESSCDLEWEFCWEVCEGNVFHGMQNEVEFTRLDKPKRKVKP